MSTDHGDEQCPHARQAHDLGLANNASHISLEPQTPQDGNEDRWFQLETAQLRTQTLDSRRYTLN